jgi:uncharacterized coiled-coil protein SlyX
LFTTLPIRSATEPWDKWADISGPRVGEQDGTVNMRDIQYLIMKFNTFGPPYVDRELINATQLQIDRLTLRVDELNSSLNDLRSQVEAMNETNMLSLINNLNTSVNELRSDIFALYSKDNQQDSNITNLWGYTDTLDSRISILESQVATMNSTMLAMSSTITQLQNSYTTLNNSVSWLMTQMTNLKSQLNNTLTLVWDSGWYGPTNEGDTAIFFGKTLNITDAVVYMYGKKTSAGDPHQIDYGGFHDIYWNGAYWWKLTPTSITFHRHGDDVNWVYVRITIWQKVTL